MPLRHRHRVGRYLIVDDESGIVAYDDQILKRWDGALVRRKGYETRHPQEFVRAKRDPYPLKDVRPAQPVHACVGPSFFIGNTRIPSPKGIGYRLTRVGIGKAQIGCDFQVEEGGQGAPEFEQFVLEALRPITGFQAGQAALTQRFFLHAAIADMGLVADQADSSALAHNLGVANAPMGVLAPTVGVAPVLITNRPDAIQGFVRNNPPSMIILGQHFSVANATMGETATPPDSTLVDIEQFGLVDDILPKNFFTDDSDNYLVYDSGNYIIAGDVISSATFGMETTGTGGSITTLEDDSANDLIDDSNNLLGDESGAGVNLDLQGFVVVRPTMGVLSTKVDFAPPPSMQSNSATISSEIPAARTLVGSGNFVDMNSASVIPEIQGAKLS